jgi:RNA polymerase sigma factor (sigma-70 family)
MVIAAAYDTKSPAALAASNLKLAFHLAKDFLRRARMLGIPREDLYQEAVVGLLRASQAFNPGAGTQFVTFASVVIRNHLRNVVTGRRFRALRELAADPDSGPVDLEDGRGQPPPAVAAVADEREYVARLMRLLNSRERAIVRLHVWNELPFERIGLQVGLSGERVRQVFVRSMQRLRRAACPAATERTASPKPSRRPLAAVSA